MNGPGHIWIVRFLRDATGLTEKDQREIGGKLAELRARLEGLPKTDVLPNRP
jgi:hypothetical protein